MYKKSQYTPRTVEISNEERFAARDALIAFKNFIKELDRAKEHVESLANILKKSSGTTNDQLFEIRHLLVRFQGEVRENYKDLIVEFNSAVKKLDPLLNDTETARIKNTLINSMQILSDTVENYMEVFEDFTPNQSQLLTTFAEKIDKITENIEYIIERKLRDHFKRDILRQKNSIAEMRNQMKKRMNLIRYLETKNGNS